jgi:hypothetical protein
MTKSFKKFRESTSAYKKSLAKIADKKKKAGMSSSDQNKMGKLAALMKKQKREDVEQVDEGISSDLKKFKKTVVQKKKDYKYDKKNAAYLKRSRARDQKEIDLVVKGDSRSKNGKSDNPHKAAHIKRALARADSRIKNWKLPRLPEEVELDENRLLKVNKLSSVEYQRVKKLKGFDKSKYTWDSKQQLYIKEEVEQVDEARAPSTVKHKGKTYYQTGKKGKDMKTGHPSFEYSSDMDGDDVRVWYNTRTKQLKMESVDEALSHAQRIKASLRMKKMKSRIKIGRERAMRKTPNMDVVKKRAFRQARLAVLKKMTKGMDKSDVSFAKRQDLEKRLDKKRPLIQRLAKRLIPNVRKADRARRASKGEK